MEKHIKERLEKLQTWFDHSCQWKIVDDREARSSSGEEIPGGEKLILGISAGKPVIAYCNGPLSDRERGLLHLLSEAWSREEMPQQKKNVEDLLKEWLISSLSHATPDPLPLSFSTLLDWNKGHFPILLLLPEEKNEKKEMKEIKELFFSYASRESLVIPLDAGKILALIPVDSFLTEKGDRKDWMMGLYDLFQNELGSPIRLIYHDLFYTPEKLHEETRDLFHTIQLFPLLKGRQEPLAPWDLIAEFLAYSLTPQQKDQLEKLFSMKGNFQLLQEHEWEEVLRVFFRSHLNLSQAAKELYVHRNTLNYRLERIRSETGLDPRNFEEAFLLKLYLLLHPKAEK
ncbi:MAG: helix-turn-helix domain-containing protein [Thermicanus sp.]|nr:helix-turn-helix domain-containing protein [Thermicanus sp.]